MCPQKKEITQENFYALWTFIPQWRLKNYMLWLLYLGSFIFTPEGIQLIVESIFQHFNSTVSNANLESLT